MRGLRFLGMLGALVSLPLSFAHATPITSPSFFNQAGDVTVTFEGFASGTALTTQIAGLRFSSEDVPNVADTTDVADASGRFGSPFRVLAAVGGGGVPTSGIRYASGDLFVNQNGLNVSDMRVDFLSPVDAFGLFIIDNDFSVARLRAFNALGTLLETVVVPQVGDGIAAYHGISTPGISYFILDGNGGAPLDSSFLDDLSYRSPVPEPATLSLLGLGLAVVAGMRLRRRALTSTVTTILESRSHGGLDAILRRSPRGSRCRWQRGSALPKRLP